MTSKNWKILGTTALTLLVGGLIMPKLGATEGQTVNSVSSTIFAQQDAYFKANGKYQHIPKTTVNGVTYRVDEYLMPNGTKGYQVRFEKSDGSKKSYGIGGEAKYWSYDWTPPTPVTTT